MGHPPKFAVGRLCEGAKEWALAAQCQWKDFFYGSATIRARDLMYSFVCALIQQQTLPAVALAGVAVCLL